MDPVSGDSDRYLLERRVALFTALIIVIFTLVIVFINEPFKDANLVVFMRILLSFGVGLLGATIPGVLSVKYNAAGWAIRATGGVGLFVLTYVLTPEVKALGLADPSENFSRTWYEQFEDNFADLNVLAQDIAYSVEEDPSQFFVKISEALDNDRNLFSNLIQISEFIEKFFECEEKNNCLVLTIKTDFHERARKIWANFRCVLVDLRGKGYPPRYLHRIEEEYETDPIVLARRNAAGQEGAGIRVC